MIMKAEMSKIFREVGRLETLETSERQCSRLSPKRILSLLGEAGLCSIQVFNCLDKAHPRYREQSVYSKSTNVNVNPIQNLPQIQNNVLPAI